MRKLNSANLFNQAYLEEKCALNELIYLLSKRWMTQVLFSIEEGNTRFSSLKEDICHISDNMLADRLKLLEQHQLILKAGGGRIEYSLTGKGAQLSELLDGLCKFAENEMVFS